MKYLLARILAAGMITIIMVVQLQAVQSQAALPAGPVNSVPPSRDRAAKLMEQAETDLARRTPDGLQSALAIYRQAFLIWKELDDHSQEVLALLGQATAQFFLHRPDSSRALITQAGEIAHAKGSRLDEATVLNSSALLYDALGDEPSALKEVAQSRTILQSLNDKSSEGFVLLTESGIHEKLKDKPNAIASAELSLSLFRESKNSLGEAQALYRLGYLNRTLQQPEANARAIDYFSEALPLVRKSKNLQLEALTLLNLGQLNLIRNAPDGFEKTVVYLSEAAPLFQAQGDRFNEAHSWWSLATASDRLGHAQQGRDAYLKALPFFLEKKDPMLGRLWLSLGEDEDELGGTQVAIEDYEKALSLLMGPSETQSRGLALMRLGAARQKLGDTTRATEAYKASIPVWQSVGNKGSEAAAQLMLSSMDRDRHASKESLAEAAAALQLSEAVGDRSGQAVALNEMASVYFTEGDYAKSRDLSLRALPLLDGDPIMVRKGSVLSMAGNSYAGLHDNKNALDYLNRSLLLQSEPSAKAGVLAGMGAVYNVMGDQKKALELEQQALDLLRPLNNPATTNKVRNDIGLTYSAMGNKTEALKLFEASLADSRTRNDLQQQSVSLKNVAQTHLDFGDTKQAEGLYLQSLALTRQLGDRNEEAGTLSSLGLTYHALGEEPQAEDSLKRALSLRRELGDLHGEAITLNDLALFYSQTGELQKALDAYAQALSIFKQLDDQPELGTTYNNLGTLYRQLGVTDRAQMYFQQALKIREETNDDDGRAVTLNNLAVLAQSSEHSEQALEYYQQALQLAEKLGNRAEQARLHSGLGVLNADLGDTKAALTELQRSLEIALGTGDVDSRALALHNLGSLYSQINELPRALDSLHQALVLWRQINNVEGEAGTLKVMAKVERKQGDLKAALTNVDESIRLRENVRSRLGSDELRTTLLATSSNAYELKIAILMQLDHAHEGDGYDAQALETSERARARNLIDLLNESHANVRQGVDPQLLAEEDSIAASLNAKALQLRKLTRSQQDSADREQLNREIADLSAAYEGVQAKIRTTSPAYAALTQPQPLTLQDIQRQLDRGSLLLEYSLGKEQSYLWAVTPNSLSSYELPKRETIEAAAAEFHRRLYQTANPEGLEEVSTDLGKVLLGPVATELKSKRLIIVSDGLLQAYVPFSVLKVPRSSGSPNDTAASPLIADHELITEPSASSVAALRNEIAGRKTPPKMVAVLADPVYEPDDPRLLQVLAKLGSATQQPTRLNTLTAMSESNTHVGALKRLPRTSEEAENILALTTPAQSLAWTAFDASKVNAESPELAGFKMVHFATHGVVDPDHPALSGIVFSLYDQQGRSIDGFLRLNEVFNLRLPVDLVVLSACQSGQGKLISGEGLVGLARGFLYAGAASMVVSLWSVDDQATAELMSRFYQKMLGSEHLRPAAALRAAQLSMVSDLNQRWNQPLYWAPFIVQGDWR